MGFKGHIVKITISVVANGEDKENVKDRIKKHFEELKDMKTKYIHLYSYLIEDIKIEE